MKRANNTTLIDNYLKGNFGYETKNLRSHPDSVLIHYNTEIARWCMGAIVLNNEGYSPVTSKHQNKINRLSKFIIVCSSESLYNEFIENRNQIIELIAYMKKIRITKITLE